MKAKSLWLPVTLALAAGRSWRRLDHQLHFEIRKDWKPFNRLTRLRKVDG